MPALPTKRFRRGICPVSVLNRVEEAVMKRMTRDIGKKSRRRGKEAKRRNDMPGQAHPQAVHEQLVWGWRHSRDDVSP